MTLAIPIRVTSFQLRYGDVQGKADIFDEGGGAVERGETSDLTFESSVETNLQIYNEEIEKYLAGYLHRGETITAPSNCPGRLRLVPSGPAKAGAVWYRDEVPINNGFDTYFTFQISDHSKECTIRKDQYFSQMSYRTCSVRGGDGFAFVVHNDPNKTEAIGENGGQMGFGGLENSLAIAFDIWQNPGEDKFGVDHISFQSRGRKLKNDGLEAGLLGLPRVHQLADGKVHLVRIVYFSDLRAEYLDYLVASESLVPYLLDNGEQKRIGTLVVFIDEGRSPSLFNNLLFYRGRNWYTSDGDAYQPFFAFRSANGQGFCWIYFIDGSLLCQA